MLSDASRALTSDARPRMKFISDRSGSLMSPSDTTCVYV